MSVLHAREGIQVSLAHDGNNKIWAIGGGKGGAGKSMMTANLSICLALMGYKVVAIDLDLGGANLHTCLGVPFPEKTLSDYLTKKVPNLLDLQTATCVENLKLISGAKDEMGIANISRTQKTRIISSLKQIDADYILLDLGAGTTYHTLDFFIGADKGILATLPEPTAIENTYRFIKSVYHRKLKAVESLLELGPIIDQAVGNKLERDYMPVNLVPKVVEINSNAGNKLKNELEYFRPELIINQARTQADVEIGSSISIICRKYFGINIDYVGHIDYDSIVWQSVKRRKPLLMEFPNSDLVNNFDRIVHRLLDVA